MRNCRPMPSEQFVARWRRRAPLLRAAAGAGCLLPTCAVWASAAAGAPMPMKEFPAAQVFTLLFLMLGPFKILAPFAQITKGMEDKAAREVALWGTLFASLALLTAAFLGESILKSYGIPVPILALSGGIILFLVALLNILHQFMPAGVHEKDGTTAEALSPIKVALTQLAFHLDAAADRRGDPVGIGAEVVGHRILADEGVGIAGPETPSPGTGRARPGRSPPASPILPLRQRSAIRSRSSSRCQARRDGPDARSWRCRPDRRRRRAPRLPRPTLRLSDVFPAGSSRPHRRRW